LLRGQWRIGNVERLKDGFDRDIVGADVVIRVARDIVPSDLLMGLDPKVVARGLLAGRCPCTSAESRDIVLYDARAPVIRPYEHSTAVGVVCHATAVAGFGRIKQCPLKQH